jgi:hypothetical protein
VTDNKSPGDRLLEFVVFGPTGLAVTLVEEFPKLVEKGRHRVEGQVHTARLVGQFAVQMGRRQIEQSLAHLGGQPDDHLSHEADVANAGGPRPEREPDLERELDLEPGAEVASPPPPFMAGVPARRDEGGAIPPPPVRPSVWLEGGAPNGSGSPTSLAIPGYDSLSASQVVQRLEGLSSPELEEVRAHEAAHRQRRTILHRVEQLLTGGDGVAT